MKRFAQMFVILQQIATPFLRWLSTFRGTPRYSLPIFTSFYSCASRSRESRKRATSPGIAKNFYAAFEHAYFHPTPGAIESARMGDSFCLTETIKKCPILGV